MGISRDIPLLVDKQPGSFLYSKQKTLIPHTLRKLPHKQPTLHPDPELRLIQSLQVQCVPTHNNRIATHNDKFNKRQGYKCIFHKILFTIMTKFYKLREATPFTSHRNPDQ